MPPPEREVGSITQAELSQHWEPAVLQKLTLMFKMQLLLHDFTWHIIYFWHTEQTAGPKYMAAVKERRESSERGKWFFSRAFFHMEKIKTLPYSKLSKPLYHFINPASQIIFPIPPQTLSISEATIHHKGCVSPNLAQNHDNAVERDPGPIKQNWTKTSTIM